MKENETKQGVQQKQTDSSSFLKPANKFLTNNRKTVDKITKKVTKKVENLKEFKETYKLIQKLSSVNGFDVSRKLLHRTMFNAESLPPLGKEYWWFIFIDQRGEKPVQLMFLIFRKYGKSMLFNDEKIVLKSFGKNKFQAVTACWVWDGKKMHDLGDTNAMTTINPKKNSLTSTISGHKATLKGKFPTFELNIGNIINLNMTELKQVTSKDAYGVFLPPFGAGWVDTFSIAKGTVFGKKFEGIGHLQKVVGITTSGCFNWMEIFFQKGSLASFFCVRPEKNSKTLLHTSFSFYDRTDNTNIGFKKPNLKILKKGSEKRPKWIISGHENDKKFKIVLETYAVKKFIMKNGGWQVYIEYAVLVKEFSLKTKDKKISLADLGRGIGTFEDAYGFVF